MEVKKCPYCNEEKPLVSYKTTTWIKDGIAKEEKTWSVFCPVCNMKTEEFLIKQDAIDNWNGIDKDDDFALKHELRKVQAQIDKLWRDTAWAVVFSGVIDLFLLMLIIWLT